MKNRTPVQGLKLRLFRNRYDIQGNPAAPGRVNLEYSRTTNIGDTLSPVIVQKMLEQKQISPDQTVSGTRHLMAVGSVVGRGRCDVTIWGSGILKEERIPVIQRQKRYRKLDIRAVRGPRTRDILTEAGYACPEIYGDPAVLMPEVYQPSACTGIRHPVSVILHHRTQAVANPVDADSKNFRIYVPENIHRIDPNTDDYRHFIDEIVSSGQIISSSLHGIILAESYGVPAIFLGAGVEDQLFKFDDWYASTGRQIKPVFSIEEALTVQADPPADLSNMRDALKRAFPYDLWGKLQKRVLT